MYVAVVGPGDAASTADVAAAREVGRLLAQAGAIVLTGGLGGVMTAALLGAQEAGGLTVALQPGSERVASPAAVVLPTGLGEMRNALLVRCSDAVVAVGGSWGTLSEIALAQRTGVPVVSLGGWTVHDASGTPAGPPVVRTPAEAVAAVLGLPESPGRMDS
ncbi:MAG TPA: dethiobiotin synthetase [Jatrophihabitans sp.]|nr:dethiobiotin synthetase [Jatrophihabitans sp.]